MALRDLPEPLECPFCGMQNSSEYETILHVELQHSEDGESPFAVRDAVTASEQTAGASTPQSTRSSSPILQSTTKYVGCPYRCGEQVLEAELQFHTDFHIAEDMALEDAGSKSRTRAPTGPDDDSQTNKDISHSFDTTIAQSLRNHSQIHKKPFSSIRKGSPSSLKTLIFGSSSKSKPPTKSSSSKTGKVRRLGRAELGPYAHEKRMPAALQKMLEDGAKVKVSNQIGPEGTLVRVEMIENETTGLVEVLAQLSAADKSVKRALFCCPEVRHVAKMSGEGGFCGYRNIQMLISYIRDAGASGHEHFRDQIPSILKLQDLIENAWDQGYNSSGRIETGGIRLTRKYIGTPEAQALFLSLGIDCEAAALSSKSGSESCKTLLQAVSDYFEEDYDSDAKVMITEKPPIYFQHQGHSMTIVGIELHESGIANLVVFDPMFNPSPSIKRLIDARLSDRADVTKLMKAHRRGEAYLSKYKAFELLKLSDSE